MPSPFTFSPPLCVGLALVMFAPALLARNRDISGTTQTSSVAAETRVDYITPAGYSQRLRLNQRSDRSASGADGESFNCRLADGENTFIVALPRLSTVEYLTLVNDNAAACGRLRISVADQALPACSAGWIPVDGSVAFEHKRRFNVSMLGVTAKFVRLTFSVQHEMTLTKATLDGRSVPADFATVDAISVYKFHPNRAGLLAANNPDFLAGDGVGQVTGNLAMADTALGFASRY